MFDEHPLSILVVEPHAKFRTLLSRRLEADGHQITDVSDCRSALEALREGRWQMLWLHPADDVSWEELVQEARQQAPECFITLLSDEVVAGPQHLKGPWVDMILPRPWKEAELREVLAGAAARV